MSKIYVLALFCLGTGLVCFGAQKSNAKKESTFIRVQENRNRARVKVLDEATPLPTVLNELIAQYAEEPIAEAEAGDVTVVRQGRLEFVIPETTAASVQYDFLQPAKPQLTQEELQKRMNAIMQSSTGLLDNTYNKVFTKTKSLHQNFNDQQVYEQAYESLRTQLERQLRAIYTRINVDAQSHEKQLAELVEKTVQDYLTKKKPQPVQQLVPVKQSSRCVVQ